MLACKLGNYEAAKLLIEAGADKNAVSETGTPLIMAVESGNTVLLKSLLNLPGVSVVQSDKSGLTPLYAACFSHK